MGWKDLPHWLKGGIIGGMGYPILYCASWIFLVATCLGANSSNFANLFCKAFTTILFPFLIASRINYKIITSFGIQAVEHSMYKFFGLFNIIGTLIIGIIIGFIIGAIIGLIVRKIKSR